jgi:1-acyl-sn-glycerol-3-phosphate acyltransferase
LIFYFLRLTLVLFVTTILSTFTILLGVFDPDGKRVYFINQFWTWSILRIARISLTVRGLENLDPSEQYVFMVNHQSNIDIPVLVQSLTQFQLRWIAKKELLWVPLFGWAMWATKHIIVNRSDPTDAVKSLERAKRRIAAGISVVVFPEGTRTRNGKLLSF